MNINLSSYPTSTPAFLPIIEWLRDPKTDAKFGFSIVWRHSLILVEKGSGAAVEELRELKTTIAKERAETDQMRDKFAFARTVSTEKIASLRAALTRISCITENNLPPSEKLKLIAVFARNALDASP